MKAKLSFLARSVIIVFMLLAGTVPGWAAKVYLMPGTNWLRDNARFAVYYYNGSDTHWCDMKEVNGTSYYESDNDIPAGYTVIFCRMNPGTTENNWDNKWNQTNDLPLEDEKNLYTYPNDGWDKASGSWSLYETHYNVIIDNGDHGTVSPNGSQSVGSSGISLSVTPNDGYEHTGWSTTGGASVTDNKLTATADGTATATYTIKSYAVTYHHNSGTGDVPTQGNVNHGGSFTVANNTLSRSGYDFDSWNTNSDGNGTKYAEGAVFTNVISNVDLYAQWTKTSKDWKLHYNVGAAEWPDLDLTTTDGNIYTGTLHIENGKKVPFKVYEGGNWYGNNGKITRSNCTDIVMSTSDNDCELTADVTGDYIFTFDEPTKKLSVTYPEKTNLHLWHNTHIDDVWDAKELNGGNCTISGDGRDVFYFTFGNENSVDWSKAWRTQSTENTEISFGTSYSKNSEYGNKGVWYTNDFKTGYDYTFTVNEDAGTFTVTKAEKTYSVTVNAGDHGSVSPTGAVNVGVEPVNITASANAGYHFVNWTTTGDVAIADVNNASTTITATGDGATVTANFAKDAVVEKNIYVVGRFKVRDSKDGNYIYTGSDDGIWVDNSTNIKFAYDETSGFYKLPTYCSLTELASVSKNGGTDYYYFHLIDGSTTRGALSNNACPNFAEPSAANVKDGSVNFLFTTRGDELVTLNYDPETKKLWYTTDLGININYASGVTLKNTDVIKITVCDAVQWNYSINGGTPIYVMDGHDSEWAYLPAGDNVTVEVKNVKTDGETTTAIYTYNVTEDNNVVTVYWDNYQPDCARATHRVDAVTPHDKPALDQAWIWYSNQSGTADTDNPDFAADNHQGARLDTEGRFLYANVSFPRLGKYMILFRNKEKTASNGDWLSYYQTVEFTGEDKEKASLYGTVMTSGTNTFKVQDVHKWSVTQGSVNQEREMWEVDYFDPSSSVTFDPATVTVEKNGNITSDPVGTKATIYDNATVTITPENVTSWRYKLNNGEWSGYLNSTSEDLDIEKLIKEGKITADADGEDNTITLDITVELVYALNSAKSISKEVTATYTVKKPEAKVNVHVSFPYGYWHENDPLPFNDAKDFTIYYEGWTSADTPVDGTEGTATLKKDVTMTENDPKFYEWYSTSVAVAGADVDKIYLALMDKGYRFATTAVKNENDVYFVVVFKNEDATSDHTTLEAAIDAEVDLPIITATPSQTFIGSEAASASYEVKKAYTASLNNSELSLTDGAKSGSITVPTTGTTTMTIKAVNSAGYPLEVTRTYDVNTSDLNGYYLVVNNTRGADVAGTNIVKYKFQPVLNRDMATPDLSSTLYTLTLPDFVLTGTQGRKENPNCFTATLDGQPTMYYTIQKGDGTVIYQPTSSTTYGDTYYAGHNEDGNKYLYIWNEKEPNKEHYISVNGADRVMMTKDDNMRINGHGPIWYYNFGDGDQSTKYFNVTIEYNPGNVLTNWYLYGGNNSTFVEAKLDGTWSGTAIIAPDEVKTITPGKNYELGYEEGKKFTEKPNGGLTNVQMESYGAHINKSKAAADAEGYNFFLKKDKLAKSYTWYLNIGNSAYAPSDHNPRFTSNAQSVAIAANQLVDGHAKNAIVEQKVISDDSKVQDYYLTGNLKAGADAFTWQPVENKMKMTRMFFANKGKSYVAGNSEGITAENCDSIVYVLQMVRPEAGWGNMYLSMAGERNLNAYSNGISSSNTEAWWATLIRPQVFTDKDAQWNFGGLEVNGILKDDGKYTTSYANTSQAINPILDNTVTGYTAYFNMTNATYRLVYYTETNSNDEGFFIIGPAVSSDNVGIEIGKDDSYHAANGRKVKLGFNSETGAYEAIGIKLTNGQNFRFANIKQTTTVKTEGGYETYSQKKSAYESYYDEDAIVPVRDGEPGDAAWFAANTWETDYFNRLSKLKNADAVQEVTDGTPVTFQLPTGTYNVRFYTKYLGANGETVTNAYYTIDYHIGIGDATKEGNVQDETGALPSEFHYHKTWSSRLAYVNDNSSDGRLDIYYIKDWTYNKTDKNDAKAVVTFGKVEDNTYIPSGMPMILSAKQAHLSETKTFVIVPGDPYGLQSSVQSCKATSTNKVDVHSVFETEDYSTGRNAAQYSAPWLEWSKEVGPGEIDGSKLPDIVYKKRNFIFGMITPNWRRDTKKELNFWRMKASNYHVTGHKILVKAPVPADTKDYESGATYSGYQSGANAKSMANMMSFVIEGDEIDDNIVTSITDIEDVNNDNRIYNLIGVEVKSPIRGQVYIINGRKTIIK